MISLSACFERGMTRPYYLRFEKIDLMLVPCLMTSYLDRKCRVLKTCVQAFFETVLSKELLCQKEIY